MGKEALVATATGTAGTSAVVTILAPTDSRVVTLYIVGIIISITAAPTAALECTLSGVTLGDNTAGTLPIEVSANATSPIVMLFGVHPLRIVPATNAVLTVPAVGGSAVANATLLFYRGAI